MADDAPLISNPGPAKSHSRSWYEAWFDDWWLWEILAILLSCGLTAALCIILGHYQGEPQPSFGTLLNSTITLNTVVSLLATLSVAASLVIVEECLSQLKWHWYARRGRPLADLEAYDRASRGTFGSLQLLWKFRLRLFPSVGALLMVVHLAIAPLAQQSVMTSLQLVPAGDGVAAAPISTQWIVALGTENFGMPGGYNRINAAMKGAVSNGIFNANSTLPEVAPACTSGNCNFGLFHSLAICSYMADVSSHLISTSIPGPHADGNNGSDIAWCLPGDHCLYVNGIPVNDVKPTVANITSAAGTDAGQPWISGPLKVLNYTSLEFSDHPHPLADFYLIYQNTTYPGFQPGEPDEQLRYGAVEFVLDWCVPVFNTTVVNGTATTTRQANPLTAFNTTAELEPLTQTANGTKYTVDNFTHASLQRYLWVLLTGWVGPGPERALTFTNSDAAQTLWAAFQINQTDEWDNGTHQVKTQSAALPVLQTILNNTAVSMSNLIRQQSDKPYFGGNVTIAQSIVHVDWKYVTSLGVFTGITMLFFLAVVVLGGIPRRNDVRAPVWKSSTLAVLHGLDPALQRTLGGAGPVGSMDHKAAGLYVRLVPDADGWRLVACGRPENVGDQISLQSLQPELSKVSPRRQETMRGASN